VALELYRGNVIVTGREIEKPLYSTSLVAFEDGKGAYDKKDAQGFIKLNALRLRTREMRNRKVRRVSYTSEDKDRSVVQNSTSSRRNTGVAPLVPRH
jgi:hypothetical protein